MSDSVSTAFFVYVTSSILQYQFFSVIENLPVEMRERLTEMRETDLQVQSKFFFVLFLKIACILSCSLIAEQFFFLLRQTLSPLENPRLLQKVITLVSYTRQNCSHSQSVVFISVLQRGGRIFLHLKLVQVIVPVILI